MDNSLQNLEQWERNSRRQRVLRLVSYLLLSNEQEITHMTLTLKLLSVSPRKKLTDFGAMLRKNWKAFGIPLSRQLRMHSSTLRKDFSLLSKPPKWLRTLD